MKFKGRSSFSAVVAAALAVAVQQAESQAWPGFLTGEWAVEQQVRDRWIHQRQLPRFTPFKTNRNWLIVDSLRATASGRSMYLTLRRDADGRDSAFISADPTGRIRRLHAGLARYRRRGLGFPGDSSFFVAYNRFRGSSGYLTLADSRVWDLVPTFTRATPRAGLTWSDTIARVAADGPSFRQTLRGTRVSRIVRDTVVGGRTLWVVRDSAQVTYEEKYDEQDRTLKSPVQVVRTTAGVVRGVHLYDPDLGLFRRRDDTTTLSGNAVLRYPDGRSFRTPARYERTRRWDLYDRVQYATRAAQLRDEARRPFGGVVIVPTPGLQQRLAEGDVQARDSVLAEWRRTSDPDEAARQVGLLWYWSRDSVFRAMVDSLRVAAGDTVYLHTLLTSRAHTSLGTSDTAAVRSMLRFMEEPELLWAFNLDSDPLYENLVQGLTTWPRAAIVPGNVTRACSIEACELLAAQWRTAREPRTRDVGLVALFSLDPAHWADTVLVLAGPERPLLAPAAMLAKGIGATWDLASKREMPAPNSDWRAWLEWMDGRDSLYLAATRQSRANLPAQMRRDTLPRVRFDESHGTAVRMYSARTGRDIPGELQRGYAAAESDSARLIFGTMLQRLGHLRLAEDVIVAGLKSGDPARAELARNSLAMNFGSSGKPMDPAAAAAFIDRLIAVELGTAQPWRPLVPPVQRAAPPREQPAPRAPRPGVFVNSEGIPESVRAKWLGRVEFVSPAEMRRRDPREGSGFYTFRVRSWGRFVEVNINMSGSLARLASDPPHHYASGSTYYLMELDGEWVIVDGGLSWIT